MQEAQEKKIYMESRLAGLGFVGGKGGGSEGKVISTGQKDLHSSR